MGDVMRCFSFLKSLRFLGLALLMLMASARELRAQERVYASSYGMSESGGGLLLTHGRVLDPTFTTDLNYSNKTTLSILGLLSNQHARYQIRFHENLPENTSVYIKIESSLDGLLGLLLAGSGTVTVQSNSNLSNSSNNGSELATSQFTVSLQTINGQNFAVVTPQQTFNAVTISLTSQGLSLLALPPLVSGGTIDVYYAYYECPTFTVTQSEPACTGHPFNLTVSNPISTGQYTWHSAATNGTLLGNGPSLSRTEIAAGAKSYYLQHSQFSSTCQRTNVPVNVGETPDNPSVSIE